MMVELSLNLNSCDETEMRQRAEQIIAIAKRAGGLFVVDPLWKHALLLSNAVTFEIFLPDQAWIREQLRAELDPVVLDFTLPDRNRMEGNYHFSWIRSEDVRSLPANLAKAQRQDQRAITCPQCHRRADLFDDMRWCGFCGVDLVGFPRSSELRVCLACPGDSGAGMVYHHGYRFCPRCGLKLKLWKKSHWFDWNLEESELFAGISVNEFRGVEIKKQCVDDSEPPDRSSRRGVN
jgi:hypothetical protein